MADRTALNRLPEREVTEIGEIESILDEGFVCHVAYMAEDRPVVIPMLYARDGDHLLIHGSNSMGLARAVRRGSPLSVAVTHVDGLVVARTTFHSSANYRSVVIHGRGELLSGDEKARAIDAFVEAVLPGRLEDVRDSTESELKQTAVIRLSLERMSAKTRAGDPVDDPDDMNSGVWAGVVPLRLEAGPPVAAGDLEAGINPPDYLTDYVR